MSQKITVQIAGNGYSLSIKPEEEAVLRKAVKKINSIVTNLEKSYQISDKQEVLSLTLLQIATELEKEKENKIENKNEILQRINKIDVLLNGNL